jgi:hypothetical protein
MGCIAVSFVVIPTLWSNTSPEVSEQKKKTHTQQQQQQQQQQTKTKAKKKKTTNQAAS